MLLMCPTLLALCLGWDQRAKKLNKYMLIIKTVVNP